MLITPTAIAYTDTAADDSFNNATGTLSGSDRDGDTLTYGISGVTAVAGVATKVGTYGTLAVTVATGAYTYTPNDAAIEALKAGATDTFTVTTSDGSLSDSKTLAVNLTGANDTPDIRAQAGDAAAVSLAETDVGLTSLNNKLTVTDADVTDTINSTVTLFSFTGPNGGLTSQQLLSYFSVTPLTGLAANPSDVNNLTWNFDSGSEAFNFLNSGQSLVLTYAVMVNDGNGGSDTQNVTVTINGTADNAAPVYLAGSLTASAVGAISFRVNDADSGQMLSLSTAFTPAPGVVQQSPGINSDSVFTLMATEQSQGNAIIYDVSVNDGNSGSAGIFARIFLGAVSQDFLSSPVGVPQVIYGFGGADSLASGGGNDFLFGGTGDDTLIGNAGDDYIDGGADNDSLTGGDGVDFFYSDAGTDSVADLGRGGADALVVGGGTVNAAVHTAWTAANTTANSGVVNITTPGLAVNLSAANGPTGYSVTNTGAATTLVGSAFNDVLTGAAGNDTLNGGLGGDNLNGGAGTDTYSLGDSDAVMDTVTDNGNAVTVSSGAIAGFDLVQQFQTATDVLNFNGGTGKQFAGTFNSTNRTFTAGTGASNNDAIVFNDANNNGLVDAGEAALVVTGVAALGGAVDLNGTAAGLGYPLAVVPANTAPVFQATSLNATAAGVITFRVNDANIGQTLGLVNSYNPAPVAVQQAPGTNSDTVFTLTAAQQGTLNEYFVSVSDSLASTGNVVRIIRGQAAGTDTLNDPGGTIPVVAYGFDGGDSFTTGTGNDFLFGGNGNDTLNGGGGTDVFDGGAGNDRFDYVSADFIAAETVDGGADTDTLNFTNAAAVVDAAFTNKSNLEAITLGNFTNSVTLGSNAAAAFANLTVTGGTGADTLNASAIGEAVTLNGGSGDDVLTGGSGNDSLTGGSGNDSLEGGAGADTISVGSSGDDNTQQRVFYRTTADGGASGATTGFDTVNQFDVTGNGDVIVITGALRTAVDRSGNGNFSNVITNASNNNGNDAINAGTELIVFQDSGTNITNFSSLSAIASDLDDELNFTVLSGGERILILFNVSDTQSGLLLYTDSGGDDTITAADLQIIGIFNTNGELGNGDVVFG